MPPLAPATPPATVDRGILNAGLACPPLESCRRRGPPSLRRRNISSPKRTRLGVRTYERLAMLSCLLRKVYVDERIIEAELVGAPVPVDLTMEEFADADTSAQVVE